MLSRQSRKQRAIASREFIIGDNDDRVANDGDECLTENIVSISGKKLHHL